MAKVPHTEKFRPTESLRQIYLESDLKKVNAKIIATLEVSSPHLTEGNKV
jgi:hypothetical protein